MDDKMKRSWGILMIVFFALLLYPRSSVQAGYLGVLGLEENLENGFEETVAYSPADKRGYYEMNVKGIYASSCKNIKAVSSDRKIAVIRYDPALQCFLFTPKKPGTVNVTFSASNKGQEIVCRGTVKVVRYKRPVKALKINGRDYAKKIKTANSIVHIKTKKTKVKFAYQLQDGWKVESAYGQTGRSKTAWGDNKAIKNGKTYTMKKGDLLI